jgi:hypothetical protein
MDFENYLNNNKNKITEDVKQLDDFSNDRELLMKFDNFFKEGNVKELHIEDLPEDVLKFFESNSAKFILPEDYKPEDFKRFLLVNHENGDQTYIANQTKEYYNKSVEDLSYLVDYRGEDNLGHAELRYNPLSNSEYFKDKPFVGYTVTEEKYQKKGLGRRRLFLMNALAETLYNNPVYSDTIITDEAKNLWEKLVQENLAKKIKEGDKDRYVIAN